MCFSRRMQQQSKTLFIFINFIQNLYSIHMILLHLPSYIFSQKPRFFCLNLFSFSRFYSHSIWNPMLQLVDIFVFDVLFLVSIQSCRCLTLARTTKPRSIQTPHKYARQMVLREQMDRAKRLKTHSCALAVPRNRKRKNCCICLLYVYVLKMYVRFTMFNHIFTVLYYGYIQPAYI